MHRHFISIQCILSTATDSWFLLNVEHISLLVYIIKINVPTSSHLQSKESSISLQCYKWYVRLPRTLHVAFCRYGINHNYIWSIDHIQIFVAYIVNMTASSNGNIFRVTVPLCGEFTGYRWIPSQRPVTRSFGVFFYLRLNRRLSTLSRRWWFKTPSRPLCPHCNETATKSIRTWPNDLFSNPYIQTQKDFITEKE